MISWIKNIRRYAALGRACENNGLAHFNEAGEMRFAAPPEIWQDRFNELERREREMSRLATAYREALFHKNRADALEKSVISVLATQPSPFVVKS